MAEVSKTRRDTPATVYTIEIGEREAQELLDAVSSHAGLGDLFDRLHDAIYAGGSTLATPEWTSELARDLSPAYHRPWPRRPQDFCELREGCEAPEHHAMCPSAGGQHG